jgi:transposase
MNGILYVMRTGCQWRALDTTGICSGATAHRRFQEWTASGVFRNFWKMSLREYANVRGIGWKWLALDSSSCKAPIAGSKKQLKTRQIGSNRA